MGFVVKVFMNMIVVVWSLLASGGVFSRVHGGDAWLSTLRDRKSYYTKLKASLSILFATTEMGCRFHVDPHRLMWSHHLSQLVSRLKFRVPRLKLCSRATSRWM